MSNVIVAAYSLPPKLVEDLKRLAVSKDRSTSKYVAMVLQQHVNNVKRQRKGQAE